MKKNIFNLIFLLVFINYSYFLTAGELGELFKQISVNKHEDREEISANLAKLNEFMGKPGGYLPRGKTKLILLYAIKHENFELIELITNMPNFSWASLNLVRLEKTNFIGEIIALKPSMLPKLTSFGIDKNQALLEASRAGDNQVISELVDQGAFLDYPETRYLPTPILYGCLASGDGQKYRSFNCDTAHELFRLGAFGYVEDPLDSYYLQNYKKLKAQELSTLDQENLLIALGSILFDNESYIHAALRLRDIEILIKILKFSNASINTPSSLGLTPLRLAFNIRNEAMIAALLYFGANPLDDNFIDLVKQDKFLFNNNHDLQEFNNYLYFDAKISLGSRLNLAALKFSTWPLLLVNKNSLLPELWREIFIYFVMVPDKK